MSLKEIGTVIATREFDLEDGGKVIVTIGLPQPTPGHPDFYCPFRIDWAGYERASYSIGVDTMQALDLALKSIGSDLYSSQDYLEGRLHYLGMKNLGFPVLPGMGIVVPLDNQ